MSIWSNNSINFYQHWKDVLLVVTTRDNSVHCTKVCTQVEERFESTCCALNDVCGDEASSLWREWRGGLFVIFTDYNGPAVTDTALAMLLFICSVMSDSFQPHGLQHARPLCPSPSPRVYPSSCPLHQWCCPAISSSDAFSFCPQSFPVSGTFPMSQLFASDDQNIGVSASASVLPTSIQGWFPGLISLLSRRLSEVFSSTTVWRHQFFGILPSVWSSCHNCMWTLGRS